MCCDDSRTVARALTYTQQIAMDFDEQLFTSKHQQQPFDTHTSTTKALIEISVLHCWIVPSDQTYALTYIICTVYTKNVRFLCEKP